MSDKKYINSHASIMVSLADFIGWVATLHADDVKQVEYPSPGISFSSSVSELFAIVEDEAGVMLVMHKSDGYWLEHFPVEQAYITTGRSLVLITRSFNLLDVPFTPLLVELSLALTHKHIAEQFASCKVIGFGLIENDQITRVNKIVPLTSKP